MKREKQASCTEMRVFGLKISLSTRQDHFLRISLRCLRDMAHCSHSKLVPGCIFSRMSSMPPSISSRHSSRWGMGQIGAAQIQPYPVRQQLCSKGSLKILGNPSPVCFGKHAMYPCALWTSKLVQFKIKSSLCMWFCEKPTVNLQAAMKNLQNMQPWRKPRDVLHPLARCMHQCPLQAGERFQFSSRLIRYNCQGHFAQKLDNGWLQRV